MIEIHLNLYPKPILKFYLKAFLTHEKFKQSTVETLKAQKTINMNIQNLLS